MEQKAGVQADESHLQISSAQLKSGGHGLPVSQFHSVFLTQPHRHYRALKQSIDSTSNL